MSAWSEPSSSRSSPGTYQGHLGTSHNGFEERGLAHLLTASVAAALSPQPRSPVSPVVSSSDATSASPMSSNGTARSPTESNRALDDSECRRSTPASDNAGTSRRWLQNADAADPHSQSLSASSSASTPSSQFTPSSGTTNIPGQPQEPPTIAFNRDYYPAYDAHARRIGLKQTLMGMEPSKPGSYYLPRTHFYPGPNSSPDDYPHVKSFDSNAPTTPEEPSPASPETVAPPPSLPVPRSSQPYGEHTPEPFRVAIPPELRHTSPTPSRQHRAPTPLGGATEQVGARLYHYRLKEPRATTPEIRQILGIEPDEKVGLWELAEPPAGERPIYSYPTLIMLAIHDSPRKKLTLQQIYGAVQHRFQWYRDHPEDKSWQNSIRHNLSLNKYFRRIARRPTEPGKGSYWAIDVTLGPGRKRPYRRNRKPGKRELQRLAEEAARAAAEQEDGSTPSSSVAPGATDISVITGNIEDNNTGSDHQTEPGSPLGATDNPDIGDDDYDSEEFVNQQLIPRDLTPINTNLCPGGTPHDASPISVPSATLRSLSPFGHRTALHPLPSSNLSASLAKTCSLPTATQSTIISPRPLAPVRTFDIPTLHTPIPRREERPAVILDAEACSPPVAGPSRFRRPPSPPYLPPLPLRKLTAVQKRKSYVQYDSDSDQESRPPSAPPSSSSFRSELPRSIPSPPQSHQSNFPDNFNHELIRRPRPIKDTQHPSLANFGRGPFSFDPDASSVPQGASSTSPLRRTSPFHLASQESFMFASSAHKRPRQSPVSEPPIVSMVQNHRTHTHTSDTPLRPYMAPIFKSDARLGRTNTLSTGDHPQSQYTQPNPSGSYGIPTPTRSLQTVTHLQTPQAQYLHSHHPSKPPSMASHRPAAYRSHTHHAPQQRTPGRVAQADTVRPVAEGSGAASNSTSAPVPIQGPSNGPRAVYTDSRGTIYPNSGRNVVLSSDSE